MDMQRRICETPEGIFGYRIDGNKAESGAPWAVITDYIGTHSVVHIPGSIEGFPVRALAKKTFLSRKNLRKVILPETLEEIGDWAFAYCSGLESVWLPKRKIKTGSGIFMECSGIKKIYACEGGMEQAMGKEAEQTAALLAVAAVILDAEYLLDIQEAGTKPWLEKWDARMKAMMETEDQEGYTKMILCGEEDYGCSLEDFIKNKRKAKVRLAMLRLLNPLGLSERNRVLWEKYLLTHTKGCESEETWEVVLKEHGYEEEYFRLFADIGCMKKDNFDALLMDMAGDYAEMKAFFISYKEKNLDEGDFFDGLSLDD